MALDWDELKTLSEVPMVGRNAYAAIAALAPGVTGSGQLFSSGAAFGTDSFQAEPGYQINAAGQRQARLPLGREAAEDGRAEVLLNPGPSPVIRRSGIVPVFAVNTCCTVNGQNLRMS